MSGIAGVVQDSLSSESLGAQLAAALAKGRSFAAPGQTLRLPGALFVSRSRSPNTLHQRGDVLVAFDGAIFNREDFHLPQQISDAELFVTLVEERGFERALRALNGDFAIALYDQMQRSLSLARDRFGVKPLYYRQESDRLAFASRPAPLLCVAGAPPTVNWQYAALVAACHYRCFDNDIHGSPFRDIRQLPAAHWAVFHESSCHLHCYWKLEECGDDSRGEAELSAEYRDLLVDSVSRRFSVAARPSFTLSGGLDSSSVLSCAVAVSGSKQEAYSTVYEDDTYDERDEIRPMLVDKVSRWHPVAVGNPDILGLVRRMVDCHDEPIATATWLSHFLLCEQAATDGVATLFGGLGGDELNAGEYEYFYYFFADLKTARQEETLQEETRCWIQHHDHPVFKKSFAAMNDGLERLVDLASPGRCVADRRRIERYAHALHPDFGDLGRFSPQLDHPFRSYLKNRTYQDIFRETAPCCLRAQNRNGSAFGIEHLLPFFDHRLVEFMFRVPSALKIQRGVTKHLLRLAMTGILPEETRTRIKKVGWNAPAHAWFLNPPNREALYDLVRSKSFIERGIYRQSVVESIIDDHERIVTSGAAAENHMMFLWQLINLELWLQSLAEDWGGV